MLLGVLPMTHSSPQTLAFTVDHEHSGIRLVGCLTLLASVVLFTLLLNTFVFPDALLLSGLIAIVLGVLVTNGVDRLLKGRWHSGRVLTLSPERLALTKHDTPEAVLNPQLQVNALFWHFIVKRGSRVKKGWHVTAVALEQDDTYLTFYTFCAPDKFEELPMSKSFTLLAKPKKEDSDLRQAGIMRRLLRAEGHRNQDGAEMTHEDFVRAILYLQDHFTAWMPKP